MVAYLNLPVETLELGTLPSDPFNERRITTSLGGPYFLQTFMLLAGDVGTVPFIDVTVGFILYAAILVGIYRTLKLSRLVSLSLALLIFVAPLVRANFTMVVLPAALFATLFWIQIHPFLGDRMGWQRSVLLGLTAAGICSLKSNGIPGALLICGFYYLGNFLTERRRSLKAGLFFALAAGFCLVPWMLDMKQKEGTYLFPIFGLGYHASAYGVIPPPGGAHPFLASSVWMWLAITPLGGPLLLEAAAAYKAYRRAIEPEWVALCSLLVGTGLAVASIAVSTGGESIARYSLPTEVPALLIFAAFVLRWRKSLQSRPLWLWGVSVVVVLQLAYHVAGFGLYSGQYRREAQEAGLLRMPRRLIALPKDFDMGAEQRRVALLQAKVPSRERILSHLTISFPFDFRRNPLFIADWFGMAGLPPGMPVGKGPDALRTYLLEKSIRYIAYDSRHSLVVAQADPGTSLQTALEHPRMYGRHRWVYLEVKVSEDEEKNVEALAKTYKHLYDDGVVYLLDLESRQSRRSFFRYTANTRP
ncbi:MAG: hypothetical protein ACJ74Z_12865 [Bryobacteraceae bacterium]